MGLISLKFYLQNYYLFNTGKNILKQFFIIGKFITEIFLLFLILFKISNPVFFYKL